MADTPLAIADLNQTDNDSTLDLRDLRRAYSFTFGSENLSMLRISQDPLFRILATKRNVPVNDTEFKYAEERPFLHKRYAYVTGHATWNGTGSVPTSGYSETSDISAAGLAAGTQGATFALQLETDYLSAGNVQNIYGQSSTAAGVGGTGTQPVFLLEDQIIKVQTTTSAALTAVPTDYFTARIMDVQLDSGEKAFVGVKVIKGLAALTTNKYLCSFTGASAHIDSTYLHSVSVDTATYKRLEAARTYVVGNAHAPGSGLPGTYNDQPFYTRFGYTMIEKQALSMDNSTMATELKFYKDEFARLWKNKVLHHKWDIGSQIYFSSLYKESDGRRHTQGIVNYALNYGNIFSLTVNTSGTGTTVDDLLDQFTTLFDPRYNAMEEMLFVVPTATWNYLHKLAGFALSNLFLGRDAANDLTVFNYDFSKGGYAELAGARVFKFHTGEGDMNVMRDIHLDGTHVKMLGVPLRNVKYRPLVGNGKNRDTTIYTGVQTIENTGVDATVNLIQTEFGVECDLPESWAIWT